MAWTLKSHVISTFGVSGGTTSSIDTTGADLIVIAVSYAFTAPTVSDNKGNSYTLITTSPTSFSRYGRLYYLGNPSVGTGHTFTLTGSATVSQIAVQAWSGSSGSGCLDVYNSNSNAGSTTTSLTTGSITPTQNGVLICSGLGSYNSTITPTIDSSFTKLDSTSSTTATFDAYYVQTTAATVNPTWSWSPATYAVSTIAAFKPTGGGGGSSIKFRRTLSSFGTHSGSRQITK